MLPVHLQAMAGFRNALVCAHSRKDCSGCLRKDLDIFPYSPRVAVFQIHADHFVERCSASTLDLPVSSDPRLHRYQSLPVPHLVRLEFVGNRWPRSYQGHRTGEHIQELRYFVNTCLSQESAERSDSWVVRQLENLGLLTVFLLETCRPRNQTPNVFLVNCMIVRNIHGAKSQKRESSAMLPNSLLTKQNWTFRSQLDRCRYEDEKGRCEYQRE